MHDSFALVEGHYRGEVIYIHHCYICICTDTQVALVGKTQDLCRMVGSLSREIVHAHRFKPDEGEPLFNGHVSGDAATVCAYTVNDVRGIVAPGRGNSQPGDLRVYSKT